MPTHRWKFVGESKFAKMYVDYSNSMTKIEGFKYKYIHNGIYPYHNPDYVRKYKINK